MRPTPKNKPIISLSPSLRSPGSSRNSPSYKSVSFSECLDKQKKRRKDLVNRSLSNVASQTTSKGNENSEYLLNLRSQSTMTLAPTDSKTRKKSPLSTALANSALHRMDDDTMILSSIAKNNEDLYVYGTSPVSSKQ